LCYAWKLGNIITHKLSEIQAAAVRSCCLHRAALLVGTQQMVGRGVATMVDLELLCLSVYVSVSPTIRPAHYPLVLTSIHPPIHPSIHDPSMSDSHPSTRASSCGRAYVGPQRTRVANPRGPCLLCLRYLACVTCSLPPLSVAPVAAVTPPLPRRRARNAAAEPPPRSIRLEIDIRCNARSPAL